MKIETVLKNIRKDLEESDSFFENEIEIILKIVQKRIKRYGIKKTASKQPGKKKIIVKDSWFVP